MVGCGAGRSRVRSNKGKFVRKAHLICSTAAAAAASLSSATPAAAQITSGARLEVRAGWQRIQYNAPIAGYGSASGHLDGVNFGTEFGYDYVAGSSFLVGAY